MIICFTCNKCEFNTRKFYNSKEKIKEDMQCPSCKDGILERQLSAPSSKTTQVLDNGKQAKKIEISNEVVANETERIKNGG